MSGRIRVVEGEAAEQEAVDAVVLPAAPGAGPAAGEAAAEEGAAEGPLRIRAAAGEGDEAALRSALRAGLALAAEQGARRVAVAPLGAGGPGGLSLQRAAELLLAEARAVLEGGAALEELRFAVPGEPSFRLFESVEDAARVEAQMRALRERRRG